MIVNTNNHGAIIGGCSESEVQHVFICGAKSIGQYGGFETFVDKLLEQHCDEPSIKYHIACKANGDGYMDETKLNGVSDRKSNGRIVEFSYRNAHVFMLNLPSVGPAVAILYDLKALDYSIRYCVQHNISHPIFYVLACRIGPFIRSIYRRISKLGGKLFLNPDGHEWRRAKWSAPIRRYWKSSEKQMVKYADLIVCDSVNIEQYIKKEYAVFRPRTTYIAYGADVEKSVLKDNDPKYIDWLKRWGLMTGGYYLVVGRFVPENNYEAMLREFMKSNTQRDFVLVTNVNDTFLAKLERRLGFRNDPRIKFVGTVYDAQLLKKIRENAYGYLHGHEVGGTNPSLLEALGSTGLNLLLDVGFNREVGDDAAFYWRKEAGSLSGLIDRLDGMSSKQIANYAHRAKDRIISAYSWAFIGEEYKALWSSLLPVASSEEGE